MACEMAPSAPWAKIVSEGATLRARSRLPASWSVGRRARREQEEGEDERSHGDAQEHSVCHAAIANRAGDSRLRVTRSRPA
jgi:hypothetical protein